MKDEKQLIEYVCRGTERAGDTLCLAEFEAQIKEGSLQLVGTGQATAFLRFNKEQQPGAVYRLLIVRTES